MIHPTAIIDPEVKLGADVSVGAYAIIEGPVRIGDRCVIQSHAVIKGQVTMGEDNLIGYGAVIGADPQDFAFRPEVQSEVRIGRGNKIREYVTIHRGTSEGSATMVGNACFLMAGAHLGHNVAVEDHVIIANNALLGGYVQVGERVFIGGGSVFHQHIRVGRLAICQGGSAFSKDIPPYTMMTGLNTVVGLNLIGLRRAGHSAAQRAEIKNAFDLLYRSGKNVSQAHAEAQLRVWSEEAQSFWEFVRSAGKRGLCGFAGARRSGRRNDEVAELAAG
jgi:UDP-N-acetylglucosamine acyltransferase